MKKLILILTICIIWVLSSPRTIKSMDMAVSDPSIQTSVSNERLAPPAIVYKPIRLVGCEAIRNELLKYKLSSYEVSMMVEIAKGESTCGRNLINPLGAVGIFQFYNGAWYDMGCKGNRLNSFENISCAVRLYKTRGWGQWQYYNLYLK